MFSCLSERSPMPAWGELLVELQDHQDQNGQIVKGLSLDDLRNKYIQALSNYTNRNVIAYYSGWLSGRTNNIDINDSDITGFMNAIKGLDTSKGLDLILHTPGGDPTATEGIVKYLHSKFEDDIHVIVPQMAMSAGTMLACSAQKIIMGKHSCIGPIDPQYGGIPAHNIIQEFIEAKTDLDNNINAKTYWELQLKKYPAAFFYKVQDSIRLSSILVTDWLTDYMFKDEEDKKAVKRKVGKIVSTLNANNKSHSRHFNCDFCKSLGLKVDELEADQELQELVLSVHHSFIITIDATLTTKLIENQNGARFVSQQKR